MTALLTRLSSPGIAVLLALSAAGLFGQNGVEDLRMTVGRSIVLDYPADVGRVSTSNPDIVDAVPVTTREILLHGKSQGTITLIVWSKGGERTFYNITVEQNLEPVRRLIKETFPDEDIRIVSSRDSLALTGNVSSPAVAERAAALVMPMAKTVVNNLKVAAPPVEKQIILRVKFAELDRTKGESLGANLLSTGATNTLATTGTGQFQSTSISGNLETISPAPGTGIATKWTLSDLLNIFAFRPDLNIGVLIKALREQRVLQILAEPNIVTTDGKEASFHVGGEFPIPVLQGGANAGAITIQFREFGIRLQFTPQLTPNGTIKMHVKPEVSSIDYSNAVTLSGFLIPALSTRKMETNIELVMGQSFAIAGLIDDRVTDDAMKVPGIGNIPILGAFFKSRQETKQRTELVVLVTPEMAHTVAPGEKLEPTFPRPFLPPVAEPAKPAEKGQTQGAAADTKKQGWNPLRALAGKFGKGE